MSYFPVDIPFMPEEELKENEIRIPKIEAANEAVKFAEDVLHIELLPWQKYVAIELAIGAAKEEKRDNNDREDTAVTWGDLYRQFKKEYPKADVIDFRPFVEGYLPRNRPGIIVWLKNGDVLVYIPKRKERKKRKVKHERCNTL